MSTNSWILFTLMIGVAVCGLIAMPIPEAKAGGCGYYPSFSSYSSVPYYPAPTYTPSYTPPVQVIEKVIEKEIAPVAVPVVVPATVFQYMPALAAQPVAAAPAATPCAQAQAVSPCQAAAVQQTATVQQTGVATQATQQVAQPVQTQAQTQMIDQLIKSRLDVILKQYTEQQQQSTSNYGTGSIDYPDGPPPLTIDNQPQTTSTQPQQMQNMPQNPQPGNHVSQQDIVNNWVASLRNNCAECHTQGKRTSDGVQIFAANGQYSPNVPVSQLLDAIRSGRMPKNRKLADVDRMTLLSVQAG
jgi:hypothetical protein